MTALSVALVVLGGLAYDLARRLIKAKQPLPPHDALVAKVDDLERRLGSVEAWAKR